MCGFNVTESVYTLEGRPPSTITGNNQTTSSWEARRDILVWNTDDKEGTIRCFPDVTSTMSETVNADGSVNVSLYWFEQYISNNYINLCELLSSTSTSSGGVGVVSAIVTGVSLLASAMLVFV